MKLADRVIIVFAVLMSSQVNAAIIASPVPGVFGQDTQDNGYFSVVGNSFLTEILDIGESLVASGNVFGFYFQGSDVNNASNLHVVFDQADAKNDEALINFANNIVIDVDGSSIQSTFTGSGNIGFFVFLPAFGNQIFFSDAALNNNGDDVFGSFQKLSDPSVHALLFEGSAGQIELVVANSVVPIQRISAPSTIGLLLIACFALMRRKP